MYKKIITAAVIALPSVAFAQNLDGGIAGTLDQIKGVLYFFLGIAMPLAVAFFFYGLIKYIKNADNKDLKKEGSKMMVNAGIALFLMVGIWSVLAYAKSSILGGGSEGTLDPVVAPDINDVVPGGL